MNSKSAMWRSTKQSVLSYARGVVLATLCLLATGCSDRAGSASDRTSEAAPVDLDVPMLERQMAAYDAVAQELGGTVDVNINLANCGITDEQLAALPLAANTRSIDLMYAKITDDGLAQLKKCKRLKTLSLVGVPITDAGLEHLRDLPELETVDLRHTRVSNKAQRAFAKHLRQQSFRPAEK